MTASAPEPLRKARKIGTRLLAAIGNARLLLANAILAPRPGSVTTALTTKVKATPHTAMLMRSRKSEVMRGLYRYHRTLVKACSPLSAVGSQNGGCASPGPAAGPAPKLTPPDRARDARSVPKHIDCSWPLPQTSTTSPGCALSTAAWMAAVRSGMRKKVEPSTPPARAGAFCHLCQDQLQRLCARVLSS